MQEFVTLTDLIEEVMTKSGYITALEQARTMEADARIDNMREFLSVAKEFEEQRLDTEAEESPLVQFLTDLSLVTDMESEEETSASQITLMTLHAAKGLEFPVVFLVGMEDGIFPSGRFAPRRWRRRGTSLGICRDYSCREETLYDACVLTTSLREDTKLS